MSVDKYSPRRASQRWLEGAPAYVLDVFDNKGKTADRYTVLFGFPLAFALDRSGAFLGGGVKGAYGRTYIPYLGMSDAPTHPQGVSMWGEMEAHNAAGYRYRTKHQRKRWLDLPEHIRAHVIARATDNDDDAPEPAAPPFGSSQQEGEQDHAWLKRRHADTQAGKAQLAALSVPELNRRLVICDTWSADAPAQAEFWRALIHLELSARAGAFCREMWDTQCVSIGQADAVAHMQAGRTPAQAFDVMSQSTGHA